MVTSFKRGHPIIYLPSTFTWVYADNYGSIKIERPCTRCHKLPLNGKDACLGTLPNVSSACCGHGVSRPFRKTLNNV